MPGTRITDRQVRRYMEHRRQGNTQFVAAAKSGFSERSARRIEATRVLPSQRDKRPRGRTRPDPLVDVWRNELVPLLRADPHLRATTQAAAERRLAAIEQRAAALSALTVPPELAAWLSSLSDAQLDAVQQLAAMLRDHDHDSEVERMRAEIFDEINRHVPVEQMTDAECVEEWRRLCKHPDGRQ